MMLRYDTRHFQMVTRKVGEYTRGYLDGFRGGGLIVANKIAQIVESTLGMYIDSLARANPDALHHVYEWGSVGGARLFDINATADPSGVTVSSAFRQSSSVSDTATYPFYNKAEIMEAGTPITISSKEGSAIYFLDGGEEVFVVGDITISQPGGPGVAGSFEKAFNKYFLVYFSQALLESSGFYRHFSNAYTFGRSLLGGYGAGVSEARLWLSSSPGGTDID